MLSALQGAEPPDVVLGRALEHDGPQAPLPFELLLGTMRALEENGEPESTRLRLLNAAAKLKIWREAERSWIELRRARLSRIPMGTAAWRSHVVSPLRKIAARSPQSAASRSAALQLAVAGCEPLRYLSEAVEPGAGVRVPVGFYVRALRPLWRIRFTSNSQALRAGLAEAWALLGASRLSDRVAVILMLLKMGAAASSTSEHRLIGEAKKLARKLDDPSPVMRDALVKMESTTSRLQVSTPAAIAPELAKLSELLREGRASDALQAARIQLTGRIVSGKDDDARIRVLAADAARRAGCSTEALTLLGTIDATPELTPEARWSYFYLTAALRWIRCEYHAALVAVERAVSFAGATLDRDHVKHTHLLRRRIAGHLGFPELQASADDVLAIVSSTGQDERVEIATALGVDALDYNHIERQLREFAHAIASGAPLDSSALVQMERDRVRALPNGHEQEPLFWAHLSLSMAKLALEARSQWRDNPKLYIARLRAWMLDAFTLAKRSEALQLLGHVMQIVRRYSKLELLRDHEVPVSIGTSGAAARGEVEQALTALQDTALPIERRRLLDNAYGAFRDYVETIEDPISPDEARRLVLWLQEIKAPSVDGALARPVGAILGSDADIVDDGDGLRVPGGTDSERVCSLEQIQSRIGADEIVLDFFVGKRKVLCFALDGRNVTVHVVMEGENLARTINGWRAAFRAEMEDRASYPSVFAWRVAQATRGASLGRAAALVDRIRQVLGDRTWKLVYVAPYKGLVGLPLHSLRGSDGWSLGDAGPVVQITKARQLRLRRRRRSDRHTILFDGRTPEFRKMAEDLGPRLNAHVIDPTGRLDVARDALVAGGILVVLAHGWFDKDVPGRARFSFGGGVRVTLRDLDDATLVGAEVVMLSCWGGWGIRGRLPAGENHGWPAAFMRGGAGALVAPLWPIPIEPAGRLVGEYLDGRVRGMPRAEAMASARASVAAEEFGPIVADAFVLWGPDVPEA